MNLIILSTISIISADFSQTHKWEEERRRSRNVPSKFDSRTNRTVGPFGRNVMCDSRIAMNVNILRETQINRNHYVRVIPLFRR